MPNSNRVARQLTLHQRDGLACDLIEIERHLLDVGLFCQRRTRRITSLARLLSSMIHSTERRAAPRSGVERSSQPRQASALATTAASGLVYFMGDGSGQFAERCHARYMCKFRLGLAQGLFGLVGPDCRRDVRADTPIAEKLPVSVKKRLAAGAT